MSLLRKTFIKTITTCDKCNRDISMNKEKDSSICPHCGARLFIAFYYCPKCDNYFREYYSPSIHDEKYDWFQNMVQHHIYEHNTSMGKIEGDIEDKYKKKFKHLDIRKLKKDAEIKATNVTVKRHISFLIEHGFTVDDFKKVSVNPKTLEFYKKCLLTTNA